MESWSFPADRRNVTGLPRPSTIACSLVFRPPLVRPTALSAVFPPAVGAFMHLDTSGVHAQVFHVRIRGQFTKYLLQRAVVTPLCKAGIHRLPGTVSLRQFPPLCTASGNPQHPIQHRSVIFSGTSSLPCFFWWQHWLDPFPVFLAQFVSFHASIVAPLLGLCNFYFSNKL